MTAHCKRSESAKVASILECKEAERDDDKQDGLLVDVPTEEERGVGAKGDGRDEVWPGWAEEEFGESGLRLSVTAP